MQTAAITTAIPDHVPMDRVTDFNIYNPAPNGSDVTQAWLDVKHSAKPIMWSTANGGHWFTTNGAMLKAVLKDHKSFSSRIIMAPRESGGLAELLPITADPPQHLPLRALINQNLSPQWVQKIEQEIRNHARELIATFSAKGQCDFIADFAKHLPIGVFFRIADLPLKDYPMLGDWMESLYHHGHSDVPQDVIMERFADYLRPIILQRQSGNGTDLISAIATGTVDGKSLDTETAVKMCRTLVLAGLDTVIALMSFTMHYLASDPDLQSRLASHPEDIPRAVDEFARRFPVGINMRVLQKDVVLDGISLKADDLIATPIILHALDETEYPNPTAVDIDRASAGHSSFGVGIHRCAGTFLARAEIKIMLEEWFKQIPQFQLTPGETIETTVGFTSGIFYLPLRWQPQTANGGIHHG